MIPAKIETVFRLWTDAGSVRQWWQIEGYSTDIVEIDLKSGGAYRIGMTPEGGQIFYISGVFNQVEWAKRLAYTWTSGDAEDLIKDTRVQIEFAELADGSTEMILTHDDLRDQLCEAYERGWNRLIDCLILFCQ